jgi:hypothetical protein
MYCTRRGKDSHIYAGKGTALPSEYLPITTPSYFLRLRTLVPSPMGDEQIVAKERLRKVVKRDVLGAETVGSSNTTDTSQLVHVLFMRKVRSASRT